MEEILQQWRDGLITDTELSMKMINHLHKHVADYLKGMSEAISDMMKREKQKYWYSPQRKHREGWVTFNKPEMLLLTREQAAWVNMSCKADYRWHSDMAKSGIAHDTTM